MLTRTRGRYRRSERGQALILALAFLAFFGLVSVAILRFADLAALQHSHTEATSTSDSSDEGGAAFGAADASRSDLPGGWNCADTGTLTMTNSAKVGYTVKSCSPGDTASLVTGGGQCLLCILNKTPATSGPCLTAHNPSCQVLTISNNVTTEGGDDYINGSVSGTLEACPSTGCAKPPVSPPYVRLLDNGKCLSGCEPTTVKYYSTPISDPLAGITETPTLAPSQCSFTPDAGCPSGCADSSDWSGTAGCTWTGQATLNPGVWNTIDISGNTSVTLAAGSASQPAVYVLTGQLSLQGSSSLCDSGSGCTDVTLYLTCPTTSGTGPAYSSCPTAESSFVSGGSITMSGNPKLGALTAPPCPSGSFPQCPGPGYGYDGVAILADPHLLDPGKGGTAVADCINPPTGTTPTCALTMNGTPNGITGSVDMRSAGIALGDSSHSQLAVTSGFLIANSLYVPTAEANGLALTGPGLLSSNGTCSGVLVMSVYPGTTPPPNAPAAVVQSQCGSNSESGVVNFNYSP